VKFELWSYEYDCAMDYGIEWESIKNGFKKIMQYGAMAHCNTLKVGTWSLDLIWSLMHD
jgi:hypothetical protein